MQAVLDQLLDQLGAERLVRDQPDLRLEGLALLAHRPLKLGIFHALAQYVLQIEVLALDPPAGAHAEIAELGRLVGVSQLCKMRSNFSGNSFGAQFRNHAALTMPPPFGDGACWYRPPTPGTKCPGGYSPIPGIDPGTRRIRSRVASGWWSGCNASPRRRVNEYGPNSV